MIFSILFILWSIVSFLAYTIVESILARCLCCFSPLRISQLRNIKKNDAATSRGKIAVIGSGIAGSGAAWALSQDNFEVHVFESAGAVGGNAKTFVWPDGQRTGLSVLAWPEEYFHNYQALLSRLNIMHKNVKLGFHIRNASGEDFVQGNMQSSPLWHKHKSSIQRWEWMLYFVRSINKLFNCCPRRKSLYRMNMLNPLNLVPLRWLSILFGVTRGCWDDIIVPMYASTFLTVKLDNIPAVILPIISDIIPLTEPAVLRSWEQNSTFVFEAMLKDVKVHLNESVVRVEQDTTTSLWTINQQFEGFDRVVFASNAKNVRECRHVLPNWLRMIFYNITYTLEEDDSMEVGHIHSDDSIFPYPSDNNMSLETKGDVTRESLCCSAANFIQSRVNSTTGQIEYTNTFILSSWIPALAGQRTLPRLVTYGGGDSIVPKKSKQFDKVHNYWNHPSLSPIILGVQYLLRYVQGRNGVFFCGSLATPGNGHDLSFCSGLAVAHAIGAKYPFADEKSQCKEDFHLLRKLMGL
jgi:hypothetical protein